jgi:hypothetical protein
MDSIPFFTQPINTIHPITPSPQEKTFKKKINRAIPTTKK